jgi:hypothetical protein
MMPKKFANRMLRLEPPEGAKNFRMQPVNRKQLPGRNPGPPVTNKRPLGTLER